MAVMKANFANIAMDYEPLPAGDYRVRIEEAEDGQTSTNKEKTSIKLVVTEGEHEGRVLYENLVWSTDKGDLNKVSLGRLRAYATAILGEEAASGAELDTADLVGGICTVVLKLKTRVRKDTGESVTENQIAKVLAA